MSQLAINGGTPIRTRPFSEYNPFGEKDKEALARVIDRGLLSGFVGSDCPDFHGGPEVKAFEQEVCDAFDVAHAVSMNSATSCLIAAISALELEPGDEVIVPPFTMSATVAAILFNQCVPVFVDVEPRSFNLDPAAIEAAIGPRTRAILVVHLFGHPAEMDRIMEIARRHGLPVIEDNAQSMGAVVGGAFAGTIGAIGIFSLNRHKLIQTGEGGICATNDRALARRLQLIRNHGENAAQSMGVKHAGRIIGYNFRMTELEAAVARVQFENRKIVQEGIVKMARHLDENLRDLPGLKTVAVAQNATHVYMHHTLLFDQARAGTSRDTFVEAIKAEGIPVWGGYLPPLYMLAAFQEAQYDNSPGGPAWFQTLRAHRRQSYASGLCPVAERLHATMINHDLHRPPNGMADMDDIVRAFHKVAENITDLPR